MNNLKQIIYNHRWFWLIVILSLLLKIALLLQGEVVNRDGVLYLAAAEKYTQGLFSEGLGYYRMPFYPLLLAMVHVVIPNWIYAGQVLTIVSFVLLLWPLYALTRRLFNEQGALWTVLLFALLPEFNTLAVMRDPLFLLFALSTLLFLTIWYQDQRFVAMTGFVLFAVLAVLTRIEGVLLFAIIPIAGFFYWKKTKKMPGNQVRQMITLVLVFGAFIFFVLWGVNVVGVSSYYLRLNEVSMWTKNLISHNFFRGYQHLMQSIKELQQVLPGGSYHNNLLEVTRHYAPLIYCIGLIEILGRTVFPTSLLAFLAFRWREEEKLLSSDRWLIILPWIGFVLINVLFLINRNFIQIRYFWIPIVLTLPWIGYGICLWWQERQQRKIMATLVIVLIVMAPLSKTITIALESPDTAIVKAGLWLQEFDPLRQITVLCNDSRLSLYADRISEVKNIRKLEYIRKFVQQDKNVELVALYLSKKKKENYNLQEFEPLKIFQGEKKMVVILKRLSGDSS